MATTWLTYMQRMRLAMGLNTGGNRWYTGTYTHLNQIEDFYTGLGNPAIPAYETLSQAYGTYLPVKYIVEWKLTPTANLTAGTAFQQGKYLICTSFMVNNNTAPYNSVIGGNTAPQFLDLTLQGSDDWLKIKRVTWNNLVGANIKTVTVRRSISNLMFNNRRNLDWWDTNIGYAAFSTSNPSTVFNTALSVTSLNDNNPGGYIDIECRVYTKVLWKDRVNNNGL